MIPPSLDAAVRRCNAARELHRRNERALTTGREECVDLLEQLLASNAMPLEHQDEARAHVARVRAAEIAFGESYREWDDSVAGLEHALEAPAAAA